MNSPARILRLLNIITLILCACGVVVGIALFVGVIYIGANVDSDLIDDAREYLEENSSDSSSAFDDETSTYDAYDYSSLSDSEFAELVDAGMGVIYVLVLAYALCSVVGIVASILVLRRLKSPGSFNASFGWSIAAAVVSIITGSLVVGVLFIISCVYLNRGRKAYDEYLRRGGAVGMPDEYK